ESVEHIHVLLVAAGEASDEGPTDTAIYPTMIDDGTTESLQASCEFNLFALTMLAVL
ncbi:unnamed protein product, partial [Rotaria magnacalcarata]